MAESEANIELFNQTDQSLPLSPSACHVILSAIMRHENCSFDFVEVVYVDEEEIVRVNREYLERAYVTDIISFRYDEESGEKEGIQGTLFCCAPRISEQAEEFDEPEKKEFQRILIHGLLHLVGYDDQSEEEKQKMRSRENFYLEHIV
ncbi:rRNA maturation RNase YbeY [Fodinibius roseus]|uniref:Endoribonuclease YbeY n=1 Tax=Fodinibius roseus TaxID=1194090 RepID=A0A1M4TVZ0_9BACT|nr:rRNA maturation RNase YbeY [Fodinibius roseus]SHE48596.1 rRNA maturation RNase YbeY [Fodinibius roseus]